MTNPIKHNQTHCFFKYKGSLLCNKVESLVRYIKRNLRGKKTAAAKCNFIKTYGSERPNKDKI